MAWEKGKSKKGLGNLKRWSSSSIRTKGSTDTPRARILSETSGGLGSSVLYRDHIKSGGYVTPTGKFIQAKKKPPTRISLGNYLFTREEDKPPIVQVIEQRMQSVKAERQSTSDLPINHRFVAYDHWHYYTVVDDVYYKLVCCFSGNTSFFVEYDQIKLKLKMSRDYISSRAREIVQQELFKRIVWFRVEDLPCGDGDTV